MLFDHPDVRMDFSVAISGIEFEKCMLAMSFVADYYSIAELERLTWVLLLSKKS